MEQQTSLKLTGDNWAVWKFQISVILKGRGLYEVVNGNKIKPSSEGDDLNKWLKEDAKAQELIVTRMDQGPLTHILTCESSRDMWVKLKTVYEKESVVSIHLLQQKFFLLEFGNSTVSTFLSQLEDIRSKLKSAGEEVSDRMVMTKILMSLPEQYKHFRSAWESVSCESQTLEELTSRLLIEEERSKSMEEATAFAGTMAKNKEPYKRGGVKGKCNFCHKPGHYARDCYKRKATETNEIKICEYCKKRGHVINDCWFRKQEGTRKTGNSGKNDRSPDVNAFIGTSRETRSDDWCMDTGASEHMCWDRNKFSVLKEQKLNRRVKVGDGTLLNVHGSGCVELYSFNGHKFIKTVLSDVLFVPDLKFNLFSVGCALDKGYSMVSDSNKCEFIDQNGYICAIAKRETRLYKMNFYKEEVLCVAKEEYHKTGEESRKEETVFENMELSECHAVEAVESLDIWHQRLAHQNLHQIKEVLTRNQVKFLEPQNFLCEPCLSGKQHRQPYPRSNARATEVLELVHTDVCGPMENTSLGGSRYFLILKDDYSSYRFVYCMKNKSEVKENIEKFISLAERQTEKKLKVLRSDNGLEFVNQELRKLLEKRGIRHQRTVVYTPEQNGRAERDLRTLVEAARTLINGMEKRFWAEAINNVVYTLNRTGTSSVKDKSPYELWFKRPVNLNIFKVFGSRVSVHTPKEKRLKWDAKNKEGWFMGYSDDVKGYRIYIPSTEKIEFHRDVIFLPLEKKNSKEENIEPMVNLDIEEEYQEEQIQNNENEIPENNINSTTSEDGSIISSDEEDQRDNEIYRLRQRQSLKRPSRFEDYDVDSSFITMMEDEEPRTFEEAIESNESSRWKEAISAEVKALEENDTWIVNKDSKDKKVIQSKWIFKKKTDESGNVVKYKARLVARGFQQTGMCFSDIYSPVAKLPSVRIFLAICNYLQIPIHQLDVCNAFLNGEIKDDVFISLPKGFKQEEGTVCKLRKSLYGLKGSPKSWNEKFNKLMISLGFKRSEYEYCLYVKNTEHFRIFILIYVDDLLLAGTSQNEVESIKHILGINFKMKNLGFVKHFLGMVILQDFSKGQIEINQSVYLKNVLIKFNMQDSNPISTPMETNFNHSMLKREKSENSEIKNRCRVLIGSLMYAMLCSRPDLCISISVLSRYQTCASQDLWKALKRVLRYIKGTLHFSLIFDVKNGETDVVVGYVDSDWAGDGVDRKSTSGYIFKIFGCSVSWASRKQSTVALSSTESEYVALGLAVSEACWIRYLIKDFDILDEYVCVKLFEDNMSTIKVSKNPEFHKRLKHVDIKFHFIRDKIRDNVVSVIYLSTDKQVADVFTKLLNTVSFNKFVKMLGLK